MSEEPTSPAQAGKTGPVAGERLAEARRARGVSLEEIARELHLDGTKVRALEQNDFARLGAPVFIKGYLRKYASVVGLSGDAVLADYERLNPSTAPPIIGLRAHPKDGTSGPWIATGAVIGVAALGAWWWFASESAVTDRGTAAVDAAPAETSLPEAAEDRPALEVVGESDPPTNVPAGELKVEEAAPPQVPAAADPEAVDVAAASQEEEQVVDTAPAAGHVALQLSFTGDCWTEVTDANGDRLYFGLGTEGRTVAVEGEPPLQVLVGDSENVRVAVAGSPYTIPRSARRGDTARFTITP